MQKIASKEAQFAAKRLYKKARLMYKLRRRKDPMAPYPLYPVIFWFPKLKD